jgi:hypothetical protein
MRAPIWKVSSANQAQVSNAITLAVAKNASVAATAARTTCANAGRQARQQDDRERLQRGRTIGLYLFVRGHVQHCCADKSMDEDIGHDARPSGFVRPSQDELRRTAAADGFPARVFVWFVTTVELAGLCQG